MQVLVSCAVLAAVIAPGCSKKKAEPTRSEQPSGGEVGDGVAAKSPPPDKPDRPAPDSAKPAPAPPPPLRATIEAPELRAWAGTVEPGAKRVERSKIPKQAVKSLEELAESIAPKEDYSSDSGDVRLRWARVMTPDSEGRGPSIAFSWGRKAEFDFINRFFAVAVTGADGKYGAREYVADRLRHPQQIDDESWGFDVDRDIDGDGHMDTVVSYETHKSNFIDGTYKGLIVLTSKTGAAVRVETFIDEVTSNDGEGEAGSSISGVSTVNCIADIGGRAAWLVAQTVDETDLNEEHEDNPEWTTYVLSAHVVAGSGHLEHIPVYATVAGKDVKRGPLSKRRKALNGQPDAFAGATRLVDCGDGAKLALVVPTADGWRLVRGFSLEKTAGALVWDEVSDEGPR